MKTVDLQTEKPSLEQVIELARNQPVLLLACDGKEFFLSQADDFQREVEMLRSSQAFQRFLDERSLSSGRVPLEEIEREIDRDLARRETA